MALIVRTQEFWNHYLERMRIFTHNMTENVKHAEFQATSESEQTIVQTYKKEIETRIKELMSIVSWLECRAYVRPCPDGSNKN